MAMADSMEIKVDNLEEVLSGLDKRKEYVAKAVNSTCRDFKSRAPAWISKAVTAEYTIKASEVKGALTGKHNVGKISIGGIKLDDIQLEYSGRLLTPYHFRMTPKSISTSKLKKKQLIPGQFTSAGRAVVWAAKLRQKPIQVEIHKGQKKVLHPDSGWEGPFLYKIDGGVIPFQRRPRRGYGGSDTMESIRTTSVPQMITNDRVAEDINQRISEGLAGRLQHHLERYSNA
jgi:hypothetical protein